MLLLPLLKKSLYLWNVVVPVPLSFLRNSWTSPNPDFEWEVASNWYAL